MLSADASVAPTPQAATSVAAAPADAYMASAAVAAPSVAAVREAAAPPVCCSRDNFSCGCCFCSGRIGGRFRGSCTLMQ